MYCGYVTKVTNIRPAENADKLNLCDVFGNTVVVDKTVNENDLYVYFPCDGQLSLEFCLKNNLLRKLPDGTAGPGYMDIDKRNVVAIKLRGNKSDGIILPLNCLEPFGDITNLRVGDTIDVFNEHEICKKYIPRVIPRQQTCGTRGKRKSKNLKHMEVPTFYEHIDTAQLAYNLDAFKSGDYVEITLKMHGTSARTGNLNVIDYKQNWFHKLFKLPGKRITTRKCVSGTRRTVLETYDGGYYGDNKFREQYNDFFKNRLHENETVYYEIVGFTDKGVPIMNDCNNAKLNDEDFVKKYGDTTRFSYGCSCQPIPAVIKIPEMIEITPAIPQSDIYVYRMTMTNEAGDVVEYTPDFMRYRCEQMGVKTVPVFWFGIIPENPASADDFTITAGEWIKNKAEMFYDGPDPIGKTHVREGVVVRIINRPTFRAYKHKNHSFKMISGIVAETIADSNVEINEDILAEL